MTERWDTLEAILAARARFEAAIPGWQRPAAYGVGRVVDGTAAFTRINSEAHPLPGVVMATVLGHTGGSASYRFDAVTLDRAIELLTPAEAYTGQDHPNLASWRKLRAELADGELALAVFDADPAQPCDDPLVQAMRAASS